MFSHPFTFTRPFLFLDLVLLLQLILGLEFVFGLQLVPVLKLLLRLQLIAVTVEILRRPDGHETDRQQYGCGDSGTYNGLGLHEYLPSCVTGATLLWAMADFPPFEACAIRPGQKFSLGVSHHIGNGFTLASLSSLLPYC